MNLYIYRYTDVYIYNIFIYEYSVTYKYTREYKQDISHALWALLMWCQGPVFQAVLESKAFLEEYNLSAYVLDYEGTNVLHWFLGQTKKNLPRYGWQGIFFKRSQMVALCCIYRWLLGEKLTLPLSEPLVVCFVLFFFSCLSSDSCTDIADVHRYVSVNTDLKDDTGASRELNQLTREILWTLTDHSDYLSLFVLWTSFGYSKTLPSPKVPQAAGETGQSFSREPGIIGSSDHLPIFGSLKLDTKPTSFPGLVRWFQMGYGQTSSESCADGTP